MTRTAHREPRPTPVFRTCDGAPWPADDELDLDAEWAALHEAGDREWWVDDGSPAPGEHPCASDGRVSSRSADQPEGAVGSAPWEPEYSDPPVTGAAAAVSDLDARLGHLECVVGDRQRATADEYRLILAVLDDAAFDPTPWVGPDPTLDRAWTDRRGRTAGAVRRDRIDLAERAAVAEIAARLRLSEQTVRTRAAHARTLVTGCPRLWSAFSDGRLSEKHAVDAARLASTLPAGDVEAFRRFDDEACSQALVLPPAKFAVAARAIRERVHSESIEARHRRAAQDRGVWLTAELDGMASLHTLLPADRAHAVMSRLDRAARHLRGAPDENRTLAQLRADAFADLVTMTDDAENARTASADPGHALPRASDTAGTAPRADHDRAPGAYDDADRAPHAHDAGDLTACVCDTVESVPGSTDARGPLPRTPDTVESLPRTPDTGESLPRTPDKGDPTPHPPDPGPPAPGAARTVRSAPPATVVVTIPAFSLLGVDGEPATLDGYGPIDLDTARRLAGGATSWVRLLTHPVTGAPLVLDRKTYRVPAALRRWLGVTSPTCVFPGCNRAARDCDLDHLTAWADGGTTDSDNLDPECGHHHRLRHETRWDVDHPHGGETTWTSPLGERYGTDPPPF